MVAHSTMSGQFVGFDGQLHPYSALDAYGTRDCHRFRERILSRCGALANAMRAEYQFLAKSQSHVKANLRFLELDSSLTINDLHLLISHEDLTEFADGKAELCSTLKEQSADDYECYLELADIALGYLIQAPELSPDKSNLLASINRLCCPKWWRRQLRKLQADRIEFIARELRQVNAKLSPYCSVISLAKRRQQKQASRDYLESRTAVNELNQEFTLAELSALSVSNPSIRRLELITRCKGFEAIAKEENHEGVFITLTTPSRFHRMVKITKSDKLIKVVPNKSYAGLTPRDAQKYLSSVWAKIQAKLSRAKIKPYGFRIAEPHHDGTPHWHFLLFATTENIQTITSIFQEYALKDSPNEKGAKEHRLKIELIKKGINPRTGQEYSATGYLIKYICKNIDGYGVDNRTAKGTEDWANKNASEIAEKIEAWSRTHRIRQFQQIGGASVTVWRELRRLSEQEGVVEQVRQAADAGDWAAFVQAMGGATVPRKDQTLRPAYAIAEHLDRDTGEIKPALQTQYGDEARERVIGVLVAGVVVLSRTHYWEIKETASLRAARQKIMDGIAEVLGEIHAQNPLVHPAVIHRAPRQRGALDLCQ